MTITRNYQYKDQPACPSKKENDWLLYSQLDNHFKQYAGKDYPAASLEVTADTITDDQITTCVMQIKKWLAEQAWITANTIQTLFPPQVEEQNLLLIQDAGLDVCKQVYFEFNFFMQLFQTLIENDLSLINKKTKNAELQAFVLKKIKIYFELLAEATLLKHHDDFYANINQRISPFFMDVIHSVEKSKQATRVFHENDINTLKKKYAECILIIFDQINTLTTSIVCVINESFTSFHKKEFFKKNKKNATLLTYQHIFTHPDSIFCKTYNENDFIKDNKFNARFLENISHQCYSLSDNVNPGFLFGSSRDTIYKSCYLPVFITQKIQERIKSYNKDKPRACMSDIIYEIIGLNKNPNDKDNITCNKNVKMIEIIESKLEAINEASPQTLIELLTESIHLIIFLEKITSNAFILRYTANGETREASIAKNKLSLPMKYVLLHQYTTTLAGHFNKKVQLANNHSLELCIQFYHELILETPDLVRKTLTQAMAQNAIAIFMETYHINDDGNYYTCTTTENYRLNELLLSKQLLLFILQNKKLSSQWLPRCQAAIGDCFKGLIAIMTSVHSDKKCDIRLIDIMMQETISWIRVYFRITQVIPNIIRKSEITPLQTGIKNWLHLVFEGTGHVIKKFYPEETSLIKLKTVDYVHETPINLNDQQLNLLKNLYYLYHEFNLLSSNDIANNYQHDDERIDIETYYTIVSNIKNYYYPEPVSKESDNIIELQSEEKNTTNKRKKKKKKKNQTVTPGNNSNGSIPSNKSPSPAVQPPSVVQSPPLIEDIPSTPLNQKQQINEPLVSEEKPRKKSIFKQSPSKIIGSLAQETKKKISSIKTATSERILPKKSFFSNNNNNNNLIENSMDKSLRNSQKHINEILVVIIPLYSPTAITKPQNYDAKALGAHILVNSSSRVMWLDNLGIESLIQDYAPQDLYAALLAENNRQHGEKPISYYQVHFCSRYYLKLSSFEKIVKTIKKPSHHRHFAQEKKTTRSSSFSTLSWLGENNEKTYPIVPINQEKKSVQPLKKSSDTHHLKRSVSQANIKNQESRKNAPSPLAPSIENNNASQSTHEQIIIAPHNPHIEKNQDDRASIKTVSRSLSFHAQLPAQQDASLPPKLIRDSHLPLSLPNAPKSSSPLLKSVSMRNLSKLPPPSNLIASFRSIDNVFIWNIYAVSVPGQEDNIPPLPEIEHLVNGVADPHRYRLYFNAYHKMDVARGAYLDHEQRSYYHLPALGDYQPMLQTIGGSQLTDLLLPIEVINAVFGYHIMNHNFYLAKDTAFTWLDQPMTSNTNRIG